MLIVFTPKLRLHLRYGKKLLSKCYITFDGILDLPYLRHRYLHLTTVKSVRPIKSFRSYLTQTKKYLQRDGIVSIISIH